MSEILRYAELMALAMVVVNAKKVLFINEND
jgi:hypothetical protein